MKDSERFDHLCACLIDVAGSSRMDFAELCRRAGLSQTKADNLFYSSFGISGDSYFELSTGQSAEKQEFC